MGWAQHIVAKDEDEKHEEDDDDKDEEDWGMGQKSAPRESLDKDKMTKDKTDSTPTNKQDPQDTPAGRRIIFMKTNFIMKTMMKMSMK